jgi:hypothetical protein
MISSTGELWLSAEETALHPGKDAGERHRQYDEYKGCQ